MKWGGVFFVKKWTFPQRRVYYVQYQYFYFTFYLFGGCVCPLPTGLIRGIRGVRPEPRELDSYSDGY